MRSTFRSEKKAVSCLLILLLIFAIVAASSSAAALTSDTFTYDACGNMINGSGFTFVYNDANQLVRILNATNNSTVAEYFYDANGQRVKKIEGNVTTYYIGSHLDTRVNGSTVENTSYYFANNGRVARKDPDGALYYYHGDHLGSTSVVTNETGVQIEKVSYYPYGITKERVGEGSTYLFTDQEFDDESGLYYYGARYYNPELTRFTQPDTIIQNVYNPQNLNKYAYVMNNPLKYTDPTGQIYIPILSELSQAADEFCEQYLPGLAAHNEKMRWMVQNDPETLWEAGSFDIGPVHVKPGAFAEKMYEDPVGFFTIIGEGAIDAATLGSGGSVKGALKQGFFSGASKEVLRQTREGEYNAGKIMTSGLSKAASSAGSAFAFNQFMKANNYEVWNYKSHDSLNVVYRNSQGQFITWHKGTITDVTRYLGEKYGSDIVSIVTDFTDT
jgi:RHS repeat-associated protein